MATRGERRDEVGQTGTGFEPVSTACGGICPALCTSPVAAPPGKPLSSPQPLTPAATPKDAGHHHRHVVRTRRAPAGPVHRGRFTLDRSDDPGVAEPGP